jgi:hypothetical protein
MGEHRKRWQRHVRLAPGVILLLAIVPAAPAMGAVSLGPVQAISAPGSYAPEVSVSSSGRLLASWGAGRDGHVIARFSHVGSGRWSAARVVVPTGVVRAQAIGSDGTAAMIWVAGELGSAKPANVMVSIAPPGRPFGPRRLVASVQRLAAPVLAVRRDGAVVVAWSRATTPSFDAGEVSYAVIVGDSAPIVPRLLGVAPGSSGPTIAVDESGAVLLAASGNLTLSGAGGGREVPAATMPASSSTFGAPPGGLADSLANAVFDASAIAADGRAFLLSYAYDLSVPGQPGSFARTQPLLADGSFGVGEVARERPLVVSTHAETDESSEGTTIAPDGALVRTGLETKFAEGLRRRFAGQAVIASVTVPGAEEVAPPQEIFATRVVTRPGITTAVAFGDVVVASWGQSPPHSGCARRIYYAERASDAAFSKRRPLSGRFLTCSNEESTLAAAGRHALAAWIEHGGIDVRLLSD